MKTRWIVLAAIAVALSSGDVRAYEFVDREDLEWGELVSEVGFYLEVHERNDRDLADGVLRFSAFVKNFGEEPVFYHKVGQFSGVSFFLPGRKNPEDYIEGGPLGRGQFSRSAVEIEAGKTIKIDFEVELREVPDEIQTVQVGIGFWAGGSPANPDENWAFSPELTLPPG